ncbi:RRM_6 domain-containing protein [Cephalotus follicularis]|uniref:RRM_6 domain-containing protein n=1 Tax=Cephalotus follicularis TaxID=3775 RepID=A0A1Q3DFS7_CEPFO|nr:RRM_6 domain-containing protein [Cephalotus follicularis]
MGKRKPPKQPETSTTTTHNGAGSSVFISIFGDVQTQNAAVSSIFSDNNPFKRKPQELAGSHQNDGVSVEINHEEPKKRKRNRDKKEKSNLDQDSTLEEEEEEATETPSVSKKSKKSKYKIPNLGTEFNGVSKTDTSQNPSVGIESNLEHLSERRKGKRKRDDVEREYEARQYATNEGEKGEGEVKAAVGEKRKKADDVVDNMAPREGFDDESKLLRTVFVGNLPIKVKKKVLSKEFSRFGEVESVRIRSVPLMDTKKPRKGAVILGQINGHADSVHAYIVFKTEQSAESSLSHNMAVVGGNHIRVDRACPPRKKLKGDTAPLYDNKRTVFVGNLPYDVKDEELYQLFSGVNGLESSVEAIRVIRHADIGLGKGIAYVLFKTRDAANFLVRKRNLKLRDRELRFSHARQEATPAKRKNSFPAGKNTSPAKKLAGDSRVPSDGYNLSNSNANLSYQGLRASKSGAPKKGRSKSNGPVKIIAKTQNGGKQKVASTKRPAVAARKARVLKEGGASKHAGSKRKLDSQTPESSHKNKKVKRFR